MYKKILIILIAFLFCFILTEGVVQAADLKSTLYGAKTTAGKSGYTTDDNHTIFPMASNVIGVALSIAATIFFAMALYGGVRWITARGQEDLVKRGRDAIEAAVLGLIIVVASYAIAMFVVGKLMGAGGGGGSSADCPQLTDGSGCCAGLGTGPGASAMQYCKFKTADQYKNEGCAGNFVKQECKCVKGCQ